MKGRKKKQPIQKEDGLSSSIKHILLIEDNPDDIRLIQWIMAGIRNSQFKLECVDRLKTALKRLAKGGIDVILMDLGLSDSQGIDTLRSVYNKAPKVPIVVLTGIGDEKISVQAIQEGAQDYLIKGQVNSDLLKRTLMYAIERKQAEKALKESEERYRDLVEKADVAILIDDKQGRFKYFNKKFPELFGYSFKDMKKKSLESLVHPDDIDRIKQFHKERTRGANAHNNYEFKGVKKDGSTVYLEVHVVALQDGDEIIGTRSYLRDISERKRAEEELRVQSLKDELTGLNNRRGFFILAQQQIKLANRKKKGFYLFFADLDGMKWINDNLGHHEGDKALKEIADVFRKTFRESDIIARMGGDEFAILAVEAQKDSVETLSDRLQKRLKDFNKEQKYGFELSLSIGVAYYDPEHPAMIRKMLEQADKLMYEHKQSKKKRGQI